MQKFINNWLYALEIEQGVTSLPVILPDGSYRITFSDSVTGPATRWEIVQATVVAGVAELERGQEGTEDQEWPAESVMYISVTAGFLEGLQQRLDSQQAQITAQAGQIANLLGRVAALEGGAAAGALTNASGDALTNANGQILTTGVAA